MGDKSLFHANDFTGYLNLKDSPMTLKDNELVDIFNAYVNVPGGVSKRNGYELISDTPVFSGGNPTSNRVHGAYAYYRVGFTRKDIFAIGDALYEWDGDNIFTRIPDGGFPFISTDNVSIVEYLENLYVAGSGAIPFKWRGSGSALKWGIDITAIQVGDPSIPTWNSFIASGNNTGTFQYKVTFANDDGIESSATGESNEIVATNQNIIINIPRSSDIGQVTKRNIYRLKLGVTSDFNFLAQIANNTSATYTDNNLGQVSTNDPTNEFQVAPIDNEPPPSNLKGAIVHQDRIFVFKGSECYFSKFQKPEAFSEFRKFPVNFEDGQEITGWMTYRGNLYIFKPNFFGRLVGDNEGNYAFQSISYSIGCAAQQSIAVCDNVMIWLSKQGFYLFDTSNLVYLSEKIEPFMSTFIQGKINEFTAFYDKQFYYCSVAADGSSGMDFILVYDTLRNGWAKWQKPSIHNVLIRTLDNREIFVAEDVTTPVKITQFNKPNDFSANGQSIKYRLKTKFFDFGDPYLFKRIREFQPVIVPMDSILNVNIDSDFGRIGKFTIISKARQCAVYAPVIDPNKLARKGIYGQSHYCASKQITTSRKYADQNIVGRQIAFEFVNESTVNVIVNGVSAVVRRKSSKYSPLSNIA